MTPSSEFAVTTHRDVKWDDPHIRQFIKNAENRADVILTIHAKGGVTIELVNQMHKETSCNECA